MYNDMLKDMLDIPGVMGIFVYHDEKLIGHVATEEYSRKIKKALKDIKRLQKVMTITKQKIGFDPEINKIFLEGSYYWGFLILKYGIALFCVTRRKVNEKIIFDKMDEIADHIYLSGL
ncbi:MAG: hypothetical protein ACP6IU_05595 [Candidatus Asgardarchaeia archaeon]